MNYDQIVKKANTQGWTTDDVADCVQHHFGIEHVECAGQECVFLNQGDTYARTICFTEEEGFFVCSWGDWYEETENAHCAAENVVHCGHCGEFTPVSDAGWDETICESCGHCVAG